MESKVVKSDFKNLDAFVQGLRAGYIVKVGIMGQKNTRNDTSNKSNADIGFIQEFGRPRTAKSPAIPMRSFLRMPLMFKADRILKEMKQVQMVKKLEKGDFLQILKDLGFICERVILDAFDSAGFGSWAKNAAYTIKKKKGSQPLIDLGFLRKSISSQVVKP
jgi:hypothetical protein